MNRPPLKMRRPAVLSLCFALCLLPTGLDGKKKPKAVSAPALPQMTPDQQILHALNRLTFGARPGDIEAMKQQGLDHWIDAQLQPETIPENPLLEAKLAPLETLRMSPAEMLQKYPARPMSKAVTGGQLPAPGSQIRNPAPRTPARELTEGKLLRAVYSNRQLDEVLTDFWYNHFNVDLDKGADRALVTSYERDAIRPHVLGKFKDLLLATAQSPAMLFYLDNWQSVGPDARVNPNQKGRLGLNENYGRELMELHTLGVDGGYTQQDVTEVARCFTGWTIKQPRRGGDFQFHARDHDQGEKRVLGVTIPAGGGMDDGLKVLDILARHPSTARFIARNLAIRFVSDNPP
ncbi:MAG: DUF1800 domain-containing protein, partial [Acidobacteriota bacterium]